jgi:hypothetical protein
MTQTAHVLAETGKRGSVSRAILSGVRLLLINFVIFAVLAEVICLLYINLTNWPSSKPTYHVNLNSFWADMNPAFGVWHRPNGRFFHQGGCFSVVYTTNSYGARDVERSLRSSKPRTVVLGDSFIEGLGAADKDRLTNILERDLGREHLNFGTAGDFGPLQYALQYKTMASKFDHNLVLVGVLPDNDFHDMSLDWGKKYHQGRYRPYYAPDFSVVYTGKYDARAGEGFWDHVEAVLRAYLASYHVGQYIWSRLYWRMTSPYSGYNDFGQVDLERLERALTDIKTTANAQGAKVAVFLIPSVNDFVRLQQAHSNRLGPLLETWGSSAGIPVKDLLPEMDQRSRGDFRPYFLTCDGHWTAEGAHAAAAVLEPWLKQVGD